MDENGEPVPNGWPEGFGPDPSVGMRPSYSVVEATNWYAYVSNNPVKYVDPTGMADWNAVGTGLLKMGLGVGKIALGVVIAVASGGVAALSGGTATPAAIVGLVAGTVFVLDGQVKAGVGFALVADGLFADGELLFSNEELYEMGIGDIPDSLSELIGMAGDEIVEGFTEEESDVLQKLGKWIGNLPVGKLSLFLNPTDLHAPTLDNQEVEDPPTIDTNTEDLFEE